MDERSQYKHMTGPKDKWKNNCGTSSQGSLETDTVEKGDEFCSDYTVGLTIEQKDVKLPGCGCTQEKEMASLNIGSFACSN